MAVKLKDPDSVIDFGFNWATNYLATGETISTSTWAVTPSGLTLASTATNTTSQASIFVSGGTAGQIYRLANTITTSLSRTVERTIQIRVAQR